MSNNIRYGLCAAKMPHIRSLIPSLVRYIKINDIDIGQIVSISLACNCNEGAVESWKDTIKRSVGTAAIAYVGSSLVANAAVMTAHAAGGTLAAGTVIAGVPGVVIIPLIGVGVVTGTAFVTGALSLKHWTSSKIRHREAILLVVWDPSAPRTANSSSLEGRMFIEGANRKIARETLLGDMQFMLGSRGLLSVQATCGPDGKMIQMIFHCPDVDKGPLPHSPLTRIFHPESYESDELPTGWNSAQDSSSGKTYYFNQDQQSQWEHPGKDSAAETHLEKIKAHNSDESPRRIRRKSGRNERSFKAVRKSRRRRSRN